MVWNKDPSAEPGKLELYTPESRLLSVHTLGVQPHGLTSIALWLHEPHFLFGVLSLCSANHTSWVATPSPGCKAAWFFIQGGDSCIVLPQNSCPPQLGGLGRCSWISRWNLHAVPLIYKKHEIWASPPQGAPALDLAHSTSGGCLQKLHLLLHWWSCWEKKKIIM